jgi:hypothetical protein
MTLMVILEFFNSLLGHYHPWITEKVLIALAKYKNRRHNIHKNLRDF